MKSEFLIAVTQLAAERNLPREMVISAVEAALVSAYRRDTGPVGQNITVRLNPNTGDVSLFQLKTVVEEIADPTKEIGLKEAKLAGATLRPPKLDPKIGDVLEFEMPTQAAGRIAAQTAKQVVIRRLREAERELIYGEFSEREGEIFTGTIQRSDARFGGGVTLDLNGRAEAVLPPTEQSPFERYRPGLKMKVLILEVRRTTRGPEIVVSRTHPDLLRRLFETEVPEVFNGIVEIRAIAREPGSRSKVAVVAKQEGVDPVGACVGLRGIRIQNIVNELQGEKIDVIQWSRDPSVFISHALSPAQPLRVELDVASATATAVVSDRSLSLAIGREGQNARLAAKLTSWKVDIKSSTEIEIERMKQAIEGKVAEREMAQRPAAVVAVQNPVAEPAERVGTGIVKELEPVAAPAKQAPQVPVASPEPALAGVSNEAAELAALEAEIAAEESATAKLSAEEELALELLKTEGVGAPEETEEEVEEVITGREEVWKVPVAFGQPQIRFAEDIQGAPVGGRQGPSRRRGSGRGGGRRDNSRRPQGQGDASRRTSAPPANPSKGADSSESDE